MAMTYLTASCSSLCFCLACAEWREVIVQEETHVAMVKNIIHQFFVQFCAQCDCTQSLGFSTGKDG